MNRGSMPCAARTTPIGFRGERESVVVVCVESKSGRESGKFPEPCGVSGDERLYGGSRISVWCVLEDGALADVDRALGWDTVVDHAQSESGSRQRAECGLVYGGAFLRCGGEPSGFGGSGPGVVGAVERNEVVDGVERDQRADHRGVAGSVVGPARTVLLSAISTSSRAARTRWSTIGMGDVGRRSQGLTPRPNHGSALLGVSCTTGTACVAVGYTNTVPLVEQWNGRAWLVVPSMHPPRHQAGSVLASVKCTSNTKCVAVGHDCGLIVPQVATWAFRERRR